MRSGCRTRIPNGYVLVKPSVTPGLVEGTFHATLTAIQLDQEGIGESRKQAVSELQSALNNLLKEVDVSRETP